MVYVKYPYGSRKQDIKSLLRKRLSLKDKIRYHSRQINKQEEQLVLLEKEIDDLLILVNGGCSN